MSIFLLGWSNWKSDLFRQRIREEFCIGCSPKSVSILFPWCFRWVLFIVLSNFYSCSTAFFYLLIIFQDISMQTVAKLLARMRFVYPLCLINFIIPYLTFINVTRFRDFRKMNRYLHSWKPKISQNSSEQTEEFSGVQFLICLHCN